MIEEKITEIIIKYSDMEKNFQNIGLELILADIGIDSITFIKIVVAIETEFSFEFGDDELDFCKFPTVKSLVTYVQSRVSETVD